MKKRTHTRVVFKDYHQNQTELLPPSLDELVPENHQVRLINHVIDRMNIDKILSTYKGGGTSSYHPRMLLKVLIYAYTQKIYTSRQIAKAVREQIPFMWLSGGNRPDFRTLNLFRSSRLSGTIEDIFTSIMKLLVESELVSLDDYFLDGTKIEANANRYSFVWKKSTESYESRLQIKIKELIKQINESNQTEQSHYGDRDLEELGENSHISSDQMEQTLKEIEERLSDKPKDKKLKKAAKQLKEDYIPRQKKYENHKRILADRNSFSKTDTDATFMRMKDDHMKNGQLKPGYNIQAGVENQFIVHYTIHQKPSDWTTLIPHMESFESRYHYFPENIIADAGYGNHQNYNYLSCKPTTAYVKYPGYHKEQKRKIKNNPYLPSHLPYDPKTDSYTCPADKKLVYVGQSTRTTQTGYQSQYRIYQCKSCEGCQLRTVCHKGQNDRIIQVNVQLDEYKRKAKHLLDSKQGKRYRSRRCCEVESVFGQIKNRSFRRFGLRGLQKVNIEFGLVAIAHNLLKLWAYMNDNHQISDNLAFNH